LSIAGYRRFASRTDLRRESTRRLSALADTAHIQPPFPNSRDVLRDEIHLDYDKVDAELEPLIKEVQAEAHQLALGLGRQLAGNSSRVRPWSRPTPAPAPDLAALADRAAVRWERLTHLIETNALTWPHTGEVPDTPETEST
jgi:hypothetical protein